MSGEFYMLFMSAKKVLREHPEWDNERVASQCGFSSRLLLVDERIGNTVDAARRELAADAADNTTQNVVSTVQNKDVKRAVG